LRNGDVSDLYHKDGCATKIATNSYFEYTTLFVILLNAVWISIDLDNNDAQALLYAHPVWIVAENLFCLYFCFDVVVRFMAYKKAKYCLKDPWFPFDVSLVAVMIIETWILTLILLAMGGEGASFDAGSVGIIRTLRLAKVVRVTRMAKLVRKCPEVLVLVKAVGVASRTVMFVFLLIFVILYIFAVVFRQLTKGESIGDEWFPGVPASMNTLLLDGIMPTTAAWVHDISGADASLWPLLLFFLILVSVILMNMLVGILVEIIGAVATAEKEGEIVALLSEKLQAATLREGLADFELDPDLLISRDMFHDILRNDVVRKVLEDADVDVKALDILRHVVYDDVVPTTNSNGEDGIQFKDIIDITMDLRGHVPSNVKNNSGQVRVVLDSVYGCFEDSEKVLRDEFKLLRQQMSALFEAMSAGLVLSFGSVDEQLQEIARIALQEEDEDEYGTTSTNIQDEDGDEHGNGWRYTQPTCRTKTDTF
jgi:hypothetical protein